jgi:excisionase family DNA binding protein
MNEKTPDSPSFPQPLLVPAVEAARLCGVSRAMWYRLLSAGRTPLPIRLGRRMLWRVSELKEWVEAGCPARERWEALKRGAKP